MRPLALPVHSSRGCGRCRHGAAYGLTHIRWWPCPAIAGRHRRIDRQRASRLRHAERCGRREASLMASDDSVGLLGMAVSHAPACLRSEQRGVVGRQLWQQDAVAKVEVACMQRVELPAMRPVTDACFLVKGRWKASHDPMPGGHASQFSVCSSALAASAYPKHRTPALPSSAKHRKHCAAKSGSLAHRTHRTGSEPAHAAQYAAGADRLANWRPSPPNTAGGVATARAWSASSDTIPPSRSSNVPRTASSCASAYRATSKGGMVRRARLARARRIACPEGGAGAAAAPAPQPHAAEPRRS